MSTFTAMWRDNPVLTKELRVRMRGARAYWILTGYLLFLSFVLFFRYMFWWNEVQQQGSGFASGSKIGQDFFISIATVQAFLVAFITPAVTSGAITIEREQRTLEMLEMTRLSRASIVGGKLFSAVSFVALLLVSSLPLTSICFFLGGVSPEQVAQSYLLLLSGSFLAGALGLVWSTISKTTAVSVILTYASLLVPIVLMFGLMLLLSVGSNFGSEIVAFCVLGLYGISLPGSAGAPASFLTSWDMRHYFGITVMPWLVPVLTFGLIGLMMAAVATVRLETFPERKGWILRLFVLAIFVQQLFFYFGARFSVYASSARPGVAASLAGSPLVSMLFYPLALLLLCIPIFSTGELRPQEAADLWSYLRRGWTARAVRENRLGSGLLFLLTLTAVVFGMYWLSFAFIGQPGAAINGNARAAGAAVTNSSRPPVGALMPPPGVTRAVVPVRIPPSLPTIAVAVVAAVIGLSSLGLLFSVATRSRWTALMLSGATVLAIVIAPMLGQANWESNIGGTVAAFLMNLYYLNPLMAVAESAGWDLSRGQTLPLIFGQTPSWIVIAISYTVITFFSLALTAIVVTRSAGKRVIVVSRH